MENHSVLISKLLDINITFYKFYQIISNYFKEELGESNHIDKLVNAFNIIYNNFKVTQEFERIFTRLVILKDAKRRNNSQILLMKVGEICEL